MKQIVKETNLKSGNCFRWTKCKTLGNWLQVFDGEKTIWHNRPGPNFTQADYDKLRQELKI